MRISHETIYKVLYIQGRGALKRELLACLRSGRVLRLPLERARNRAKSFLTTTLMISDRPAEIDDRAVPGHWEAVLILGGLVDRHSGGAHNALHDAFASAAHGRPW